MKQRVTPGTSALFLLSSDAAVDRVKDGMAEFKGELIASNLSSEQERSCARSSPRSNGPGGGPRPAGPPPAGHEVGMVKEQLVRRCWPGLYAVIASWTPKASTCQVIAYRLPRRPRWSIPPTRAARVGRARVQNSSPPGDPPGGPSAGGGWPGAVNSARRRFTQSE